MARIRRSWLLGTLFLVSAMLSAAPVTTFNISKGDPRVIALEKCGDDGNCFSVDLSAPGTITSIDWTCEGEACGWVHPCPDGGKCGLRADTYVITGSGSTATWFGWTNSGNPKAVYKFTIHY